MSRRVLVLYGLTGCTGLLAEQGLEKYLGLLVGVTAAASAAVLFTYFLGFALGGVIAARLLRRGVVRRPLRAYGLLELGVGAACAAFSYLFHPAIEWLAPLQNAVTGDLARQAVRFASACVLVLPIATLMGASFPLIAETLDRQEASKTRRWSVAYGANLAGAILGSVLAPYFLIPQIGLRGAMWLCFAICAGVAIASWSLEDSSGQAKTAAAPIAGGRLNRDTLLLLMASFLSGLVFFALEVIWTHLIGTVVGGSVYAFSSMLTSVLLGLWIGSAIVNRSGGSPMMPLGVLFQACVLAMLVQLRVWDGVGVLFVAAGPTIYRGFYTREFYRLFVATLLIVPPAALLGTIYPRLLRSPLIHGGGNGWLAGYLSAANSLGCLLGALAGTFVLIPWLGSEGSLKAVILTLAALSLAFLAREPDLPLAGRAVAGVVVALFAGLAMFVEWDWKLLTSGVSMYFGEVVAARESESGASASVERALLFRDEHIQGGFTTVVDDTYRRGSEATTIRSMFTNGKLQGNDNPQGEVGITFGMVTAPALFAGRLDRALLIGLGTGQSAGLLKQAGFREVDVAEFSPGIVLAAANFTHINRHVLADPSVRVILEDGRNILLTHSHRTYNVITVLLTTIWFSGATNLYSREFYELARRRLDAGGVLQQWVQLHRIGPEAISSAIATARAVFPFVAYWQYGGQGMILSANRPLQIRPNRKEELAARFGQSPGLSPERARRIVDEIAHAELLGSAGVDALVAGEKPVINTDHNRYIEYATPKYSSAERDWRAYNIEYFRRWNARATQPAAR